MAVSLPLRPLRPRPQPSPIGSAVIGSVMEAAFVRRTWSVARQKHAPRGHTFFAINGHATFDGGDDGAIELKAPFVLWLPSRSRGEFRLEAGGEGIALSVLDDFLWRTVGGSGLAAHLRPLLDRIAVATPDRIAPHLAGLANSFSALALESRDQHPGASIMLGLHLGIVLIGLWRASGLDALSDLRAAGAGTAQRFRQLIELHYREGLGVDEFARLLGVTRSHLHDACARSAGATPLGLIHERLVEGRVGALRKPNYPSNRSATAWAFAIPAISTGSSNGAASLRRASIEKRRGRAAASARYRPSQHGLRSAPVACIVSGAALGLDRRQVIYWFTLRATQAYPRSAELSLQTGSARSEAQSLALCVVLSSAADRSSAIAENCPR
jgi:AraC family transcriptional activator of pobA